MPSDRTIRVVVAVISGVGPRMVRRSTMPALFSLATAASATNSGGVGVIAASPYPNMMSLCTGAGPARHGVYARSVLHRGVELDARQAGLPLATLFTAARLRHIDSTAAFSDAGLENLVTGRYENGEELDAGCGGGEVVSERDDVALSRAVAAIEAGTTLVMLQLRGAYEAAQRFGPDADGAIEALRRVDHMLDVLAQTAERTWANTVFVVLSDHGMESRTRSSIDLSDRSRLRGIDVHVIVDGSMAFVLGFDPRIDDWLRRLPGLAGVVQQGAGLRAVWCERGSSFDHHDEWLGVHGAPNTAEQIAVVTGGHRAVAAIARSISARTPHITDWATTIAALLGLDLPAASGRSLLMPSPVPVPA